MSAIEPVLNELKELTGQRKFTQALTYAQNSMKKFRDSRPLAIELASLLYICKQFDQSLSLYFYLHKQMQEASKQTEIEVLLGIANNQIRKKLFKEATGLLEKLYTVAPNDPLVLIPLATCRREQKKT